MDLQNLSYLSINNQTDHFKRVLSGFHHAVLVSHQAVSSPESFFSDFHEDWKEINLTHFLGLSDKQLQKEWKKFCGKPGYFIVRHLDELTHSEQLFELFCEALDQGRSYFLASIDWSQFRVLESKPEIASRLRFLIPDISAGACDSQSALVVGATSLLGAALMRILPDRFTRLEGTGFSKAEQFGYAKLDVTSEESVKAYFESNTKPDVLIYVSGEANADKAETEKEKAYAVNTEAVSLLHKYCPQSRFVYMSTEYIFDGKSSPHTSVTTPNPVNYYGRTKLEGEWLSLKLFENAISLRLGALYGYNGTADKKTTVSKMIDALAQNQPLKVDDTQIKHPILLDDVARTLIKLLEQGAKGVYQANGTSGYNKVQMAKIACRVWNESADKAYSQPIEGFTETGGCRKPVNTFMVNVDTPVSFEDGLRFMIGQMNAGCSPKEAVNV